MITYGYSMGPSTADPLVALIEKMMDNLSLAQVPLSFIVDILPLLRHLPEGFPGTRFKKLARDLYQTTRGVLDAPYYFVQEQMARGTNRPSYVSSLIHKLSHDSGDKRLSKQDEDTIKETAGIVYGGGADTTVSTLSSFVLAMLLFPEVQKKAQKEIDDVIGPTRLPGFEDHERLPYVNALIKESMRWFPVLPMNTAHATDEEIVYEGYRIPKGSYLLTSNWWLLHDPEVYPDPSAFDPERYIEPRSERDPLDHAFGYGRRICPGRHFAMNSLFITISRFLATFNIIKKVSDGIELEVKVEATPGIINHPTPYPYTIKVRSEKYADLIRSVEQDHPWERSDGGLLKIH